MKDFTTPGATVRGIRRGIAMRGAKQIQYDVRTGGRHDSVRFGVADTYRRTFQEPNGTPYR